MCSCRVRKTHLSGRACVVWSTPGPCSWPGCHTGCPGRCSQLAGSSCPAHCSLCGEHRALWVRPHWRSSPGDKVHTRCHSVECLQHKYKPFRTINLRTADKTSKKGCVTFWLYKYSSEQFVSFPVCHDAVTSVAGKVILEGYKASDRNQVGSYHLLTNSISDTILFLDI